MIDKSLLEVLGCPLEPERPPFREEGNYLVCTSCGSAFPIKDGIPFLLPEDAISKEEYEGLKHA